MVCIVCPHPSSDNSQQVQEVNRLDVETRYFVFCFSSHCITELMNGSIGCTYAQDLERVVSKILSAW